MSVHDGDITGAVLAGLRNSGVDYSKVSELLKQDFEALLTATALALYRYLENQKRW